MSWFAKTYVDAREKFIKYCKSAGAQLEKFSHPLKAPGGEELAVDVAVIGNPHADKVAMIISGTHGVEGFAGSACQANFADKLQANVLPADTSVILVHALNPWGIAWLRRENEENIDLNRNFLDHRKPYPKNDDYGRIHRDLKLDGHHKRDLECLRKKVDGYVAAIGIDKFIESLSRGQYEYPDGLFFGGRAPAWSNRIFTRILDRYLSDIRTGVLIDIHTGLGSFGKGTILSFAGKGSRELSLVRKIFGSNVMAPYAADTPIPRVRGSLAEASKQTVRRGKVIPIVLEFGTYDPVQDICRHLRENWCWRNRQIDKALVKKIKREHVEQACPESRRWRKDVLAQSEEVFERAINNEVFRA